VKPEREDRVWLMISIRPWSFGRSYDFPFSNPKPSMIACVSNGDSNPEREQDVKEAVEEAKTVDIIVKET
jgi:hypothetical protein